MNRIEQIALKRTNSLEGKRVVVTGCGYKPLDALFYSMGDNTPSHDSIMIDGKEAKINIGTAIAAVLALHGATVHMVSTSSEKLAHIKAYLDVLVGSEPSRIEHSVVDLLDEVSVAAFVQNLPRDKTLYWVQSVGLGAGNYKVENDNPYLPIEKIPTELIESELDIVKATHIMLKEFLPLFKQQNESRIVVVSSMSAIRGYAFGGAHCAAKGAIDRYANSLMLGTYKEKIYVSTIRPGGVDTGMYDNPFAQEAIKAISEEYGCPWRKTGIRLAPPTSVAEAVSFVLTTPAHVPSLNLVSQGQFPHEGS